MSTVPTITQDLRSQQAQQVADRAAMVARALQSQASDAREEASRAQQTARSLEIKAGQAQDNAAQARMGVQFSKSVGNMQSQQADVYSKLPEMTTQGAVADAPTLNLVSTATSNNVGTIIDTTA